jgi:hypothetical protein
VHDNPIAQDHLYRESIFELILSLKSVDCIDRSGERVKEEDVSDYITNREPSYIDLTDLLCDEGENELDQFAPRQQDPESPNTSGDARNSMYESLRRMHSQPTQRPIRQGTGALFDSSSDEDSEMGGPMMRHFQDFVKKNQKKE